MPGCLQRAWHKLAHDTWGCHDGCPANAHPHSTDADTHTCSANADANTRTPNPYHDAGTGNQRRRDSGCVGRCRGGQYVQTIQ